MGLAGQEDIQASVSRGKTSHFTPHPINILPMPHSVSPGKPSTHHDDEGTLPDAPPVGETPNGAEDHTDAPQTETTGDNLADLLFDDDDDDEYPASSAPETKTPAVE